LRAAGQSGVRLPVRALMHGSFSGSVLRISAAFFNQVPRPPDRQRLRRSE